MPNKLDFHQVADQINWYYTAYILLLRMLGVPEGGSVPIRSILLTLLRAV